MEFAIMRNTETGNSQKGVQRRFNIFGHSQEQQLKVCISKLVRILFKNHYLNQSWIIVKWTLMNKLK